MSSDETKILKNRILSLERENELLRSDNEDKDRLIGLLEKKVGTLEKLSKFSTPSKEGLSLGSRVVETVESKKEIPSTEEKIQEVRENLSLGEAVTLFARHGKEFKSYRDEMEKRGINVPYKSNPIGTLKDGTIVELNKKEETNFSET